MESPVPLQLPIMYLSANETLAYGYAYADDLSAVERIREILEAKGVELRLLYSYFEPKENRFMCGFVLDFRGGQANEHELEQALNQLAGVRVVGFGAPGEGLAASQRHQLQAAGTPVAVFARPIIGGTYRYLVENFGEEMENQLFRAGEDAGRQTASGVPGLANSLGMKLDPQVLRDRFSDLQVFGWGEILSLSADKDLAGEALLTGDFEAAAWHGDATRPMCHWIRGFITGALSSLERRPFEVKETECQAKGDRYCHFVFHPVPVQ